MVHLCDNQSDVSRARECRIEIWCWRSLQLQDLSIVFANQKQTQTQTQFVVAEECGRAAAKAK